MLTAIRRHEGDRRLHRGDDASGFPDTNQARLTQVFLPRDGADGVDVVLDPEFPVSHGSYPTRVSTDPSIRILT